MKIRQEEHEKRKRDRVDLLHATQTNEILIDPEFKKQKEIIVSEKEKMTEAVKVIKNDTIMQKDCIQRRLAERKRRKAQKQGVNGSGGSFISEALSPNILNKSKNSQKEKENSKEFIPIL